MWSTTATHDAKGVAADEVWAAAYADAAAWPHWNDALAKSELDGPLAVGATARVRFRTGLRLTFHIVEAQAPTVFTDESRLPGARMGHRHELEPTEHGVRLVNTIYISGPLAGLWSKVLGPQARRGLPDWQRKAVALAAGSPEVSSSPEPE